MVLGETWRRMLPRNPSAPRLGSAQQGLGERPLGIDPLQLAYETRAFGHGPNLLRPEFIAALRPDRLALLQVDCEISIDGCRLIRCGPQVHFDALLGRVVSRF